MNYEGKRQRMMIHEAHEGHEEHEGRNREAREARFLPQIAHIYQLIHSSSP